MTGAPLRAVTRLGVAAATMAMLALPTLTYFYVRDKVHVDRQTAGAEPAALSAALRDEYTAFARQPGRSFVVVGYHDIVARMSTDEVPAGARRVSVGASAFAGQLRMLALAGFRSISASEAVAFVTHGTPLPPRAVLITFDGANVRDWTHADPILARYGFRASIFVDPATVGASGRPSSLSWPTLRAMAGTGRWSVGVAGTAAAVGVDADGRKGSALLVHRWLPASHRAETGAEFIARVRQGLAGARRMIVNQGLPVPVIFSYPFQPGYPLDRVAPTFAELVSAVDAMFAVSVLTDTPDRTVDPGWVAKRVLPRMEVYGPTTDRVLFARIRDASAT